MISILNVTNDIAQHTGCQVGSLAEETRPDGFLRNLGDIGLFIHAMIDAIIFPIPALFSQLSLSALSPDRAIWLATIGFVGCLIGTPIGYGIGKVSGNLVLTKIMKKNGTIRPPHCSPSTGKPLFLLVRLLRFRSKSSPSSPAV